MPNLLPAPRRESSGFQIDCGHLAVLPSLEFVRDLLVLAQAAEPCAFDRRDMHEHVLGFVVRLNESEPFGGIEKLYGTGRHGNLSIDSVAAHKCVQGIKLSVGETRS